MNNPAPLATKRSASPAPAPAPAAAPVAAPVAAPMSREAALAAARALLAHHEAVVKRQAIRQPALGAFRTMRKAGIPARQAAKAARALADSYRAAGPAPAPIVPGFIPRPVAPASTQTVQQAAAMWDSRQAHRYKIVSVTPNPKKSGTQARLDYDCWSNCATLADYLNHPAMQRPTKRGVSSAHAEYCVNYDLAKGYVQVVFE